MSDFTNVGGEIGNFLGGMFNPILGGTTTTTTEAPKESGSNKTVLIVVGVVLVIVIGFFVLKPKNQNLTA